jgi:hypothetical protein
VDWFILSGKTCNLDLVNRQVRQVLSNSRQFVRNPERVTFVPEDAKLGTSAGACYGEKRCNRSFAAEGATELLPAGANQLFFDINNLFFFLPCSFLRKAIGDTLRIFRAGQELHQLHDEPVGKSRTGWLPPQLDLFVTHQDFENGAYQLLACVQSRVSAEDPGDERYKFSPSDQIPVRGRLQTGHPGVRQQGAMAAIHPEGGLPRAARGEIPSAGRRGSRQQDGSPQPAPPAAALQAPAVQRPGTGTPTRKPAPTGGAPPQPLQPRVQSWRSRVPPRPPRTAWYGRGLRLLVRRGNPRTSHGPSGA